MRWQLPCLFSTPRTAIFKLNHFKKPSTNTLVFLFFHYTNLFPHWVLNYPQSYLYGSVSLCLVSVQSSSQKCLLAVPFLPLVPWPDLLSLTALSSPTRKPFMYKSVAVCNAPPVPSHCELCRTGPSDFSLPAASTRSDIAPAGH